MSVLCPASLDHCANFFHVLPHFCLYDQRLCAPRYNGPQPHLLSRVCHTLLSVRLGSVFLVGDFTSPGHAAFHLVFRRVAVSVPGGVEDAQGAMATDVCVLQGACALLDLQVFQ